MISALLSFLGGSAFRLLMGELVGFLKSRQEQKHEVELMRVQNELEGAQHARNLEAIKIQADLGVKTIEIKAEGDVALEEARAFTAAQLAASKPTGIRWVDSWNASVRPAYATVALVVWFLALLQTGFKPTDWDLSLMAVIVGFYFADRSLRKVGR